MTDQRVIGSYQALTKALKEVYTTSQVRRMSKKERLAKAQELGWVYDPPANFGTNTKVTHHKKVDSETKEITPVPTEKPKPKPEPPAPKVDPQREEKIQRLQEHGLEPTEENIKNTIILEQSQYDKFKAKSDAFRNTPDMAPVIKDDQIYWKKKDAVKSAVSETMQESLQRAKIKSDWEYKKDKAEATKQVQEQMLERHQAEWERKKAGSGGAMSRQTLGVKTPEEFYTEATKTAKAEYERLEQEQAKEKTRQLIENIGKDPLQDAHVQAYQKNETMVSFMPETIPRSQNPDPLVDHELRRSFERDRAVMKFDPAHPIESARQASDAWGDYLEYKEQEIQVPYKRMQRANEEAILRNLEISKSDQTVHPQDLKSSQFDMMTLESMPAGDLFKYASASAVLGTAKGAKNVLVDMPLHPVQTVKGFGHMVAHPIETGKEMGIEILKNPIGGSAELGTELFILSRATKVAQRIIKPKVKQTPIHAKEVKRIRTLRKNPKTGELVEFDQIQLDVVQGKPRKKWFWQKDKIKPKEHLNVEAERIVRENFKDVGHTEISQSGVKAELDLKDSATKAKLELKEIDPLKEQSVEVFDPAQGYSGKLKSGTPLEGETPKLKSYSHSDIKPRRRAGYEYQRIVNKDLLIDPGKRISYPFEKRKIKVPEKTTTEAELTHQRTYRSTDQIPGDLIMEEQMRGSFVKRQYNKKPLQDPAPKPPSDPSKPSMIAEIKPDGSVVYKSITESGKEIPHVGKKPLSPNYEKLNKALEKTTPEDPMLKRSLQKSGEELLQEPTQKAKTHARTQDLPVIDVVETSSTPKDVPVMIQSFDDQAPSQTQAPQLSALTLISQEQADYSQSTQDTGLVLKPLFPIHVLSSDDTQELTGIKGSVSESIKPESSKAFEPVVDIRQEDDTSDILGVLPGIGTDSLLDPQEDLKPAIEPVIDVNVDQGVREKHLFQGLHGYEFEQRQDFEFPDELKFKDDPGTPLIDEDFKDDDEILKDYFLGFDAYVKRKGKKVKLTTKGSLPEREAFLLGAEEVEHSPSATFWLEPSMSPMQTDYRRSLRSVADIENQFYEGGDGSYIERSKYRINTPGEVAGISHKGGLIKQSRDFLDYANKKLPKVMEDYKVGWINDGGKKSKNDNLFGGSLL